VPQIDLPAGGQVLMSYAELSSGGNES
jgi:hypothetical protein